MAIVVVGGGAIGLLVAGRLAQSSQQVAVLARPKVVAALATHPLHITQKKDVRSIAGLIPAVDPASLPLNYQNPELAILSVKGYDTAGALPTLQTLNPRRVLTLQNGLGNEEVLAASLGPERVFAGAITSSVEPTGLDAITVTKSGGICLAPVGGTPDLAPYADMFRSAGFTTKTYPNYRALKWSKALLNMLGNATSAILDMSVEAVYADPRMVALERDAFLEGLEVMQHLGIKPVNLPGYPAAMLARVMQRLPFPILLHLLRKAIAGGRGGKAPSLQRDLQQQRKRTEGDYLYGAIARTASQIGVVAKVNAALWFVLQGIVEGTIPRDYFRHNPERLLASLGRK